MSVECSDHRQIDITWKGSKSLTYTLKYDKIINTTHRQHIDNLTLNGVNRYSLACLEANTTYAISLKVHQNAKEAKHYIDPPILAVSTGKNILIILAISLRPFSASLLIEEIILSKKFCASLELEISLSRVKYSC